MKLKKFIRKVKKINIVYFNKIKYFKYYKKLKVISNVIFIEAQNAKSIKGNMYYLAKELTNNSEYKDYKIFFSINKKDYKISKQFFKNKKMDKIVLVKFNTRKYFKLLAQAKYLLTDTSLHPVFIKKEGQVILNTWHGTPLKTLGKKVNNDFHTLGNVQRSLAMSDYLLYPNEYTMNHIVEDYMFSNLSDAKILLEGYPRNEVFFDNELKEKIRKEQNLEEKQVIVYMPTWRGSVSKIEGSQQQKLLEDYLYEIDRKLDNGQVLYVNLHPFLNEIIDYTKFKNIMKFPKEYETYEFLSIADCLITDYSSVFFDFAVTGKKIILFTYDEEEYLRERGLYISLNELPFSKVNTVEDVIEEINLPKKYDDNEFINRYCQYDEKNASKKICKKVILGQNVDIKTKELPKNNKENILIYVGSLSRNGITSSIKALLNKVDLEKKNYYINFRAQEVSKNKEVLREFPEKVNYIPMQGKMNLSIFQKIIGILYRKNRIKDEFYIKNMTDAFKYEIKRLFPNMKFSTTIQFCGYGYKQIMLYSLFEGNKVIYVHNDMIGEIETRKNQRFGMLQYAYNKYDKIALVTDDLMESTQKIADRKDGYFIVNNIIDNQNILNLAKKDVEFDPNTESNIEIEKLKEILDNNQRKIITIGRFSPEKGHIRLIDAFEKMWKKDDSIYLIIVGGNGEDYKKTAEYIKKQESKQNIIIIKAVSNPYAILKKCDYFILPSFYEGFGLVIAEADILGKPVISTDIVGPRGFITKNKRSTC